ncbi:MAG: DHHA1 domain-containing protein [Pyrinomonadaceae bacterium]
MASLFSCARDDAASLASRMVEDNKDLHRRVWSLEEIAARVEAEELLTHASPNPEGIRLVTKILDDRNAESLKHLAQALIAHPQTIALLGSRDREAARLVFARSADAPGDMNALMKEACALLDGRGGGKPDMAQGGGKNVSKIEEAIQVAARALSEN